MNTTLQYEKFMEYDQARVFLHYLVENSLDSVKKNFDSMAVWLVYCGDFACTLI